TAQPGRWATTQTARTRRWSSGSHVTNKRYGSVSQPYPPTWTKISGQWPSLNVTAGNTQLLVSFGTRLDAAEKNATRGPSPLMAGSVLASFACAPALLTLTRSVVPVCRSRTNTSVVPLVSPGTRLLAVEVKATKRPSVLIATLGLRVLPLAALPWVLPVATLTRSAVPGCRSWTTDSATPVVSAGTRIQASESKAMKRPSLLLAGAPRRPLMLFPCVPSVATLTRSVIPGAAWATSGASTSSVAR